MRKLIEWDNQPEEEARTNEEMLKEVNARQLKQARKLIQEQIEEDCLGQNRRSAEEDFDEFFACCQRVWQEESTFERSEEDKE